MAYSRSVAPQKVIFATVVLMLVFAICESNSQRLCGSKLTDALRFVCKNNYNPVGKKSVKTIDYFDDDDIFNFDSNERTPFMNKLDARTLLNTLRRREGIVNECCRKPCTLVELSAYCYQSK